MDSHVADPGYVAAVRDLLGVLAYGELTACLRMAGDGQLAPSLNAQAGMARLAAIDYRHHELLVERMEELGIDPQSAMQPFVVTFAGFHARTRPKSWIEGLMKAYIGDGIARDFYREMAGFVDAQTRAVMEIALDDAGAAEFVVRVIRDTIATDPSTAGRLALWGRRLLGEALSHAQAVAVERDALAALLMGGGGGLAEVGEMFARLQGRHMERMARLGLDS